MILSTIGVAVGLALILEGLLPALAPGTWRRSVERIMAMADGQVRFVGVSAVVVGAFVVLVSA